MKLLPSLSALKTTFLTFDKNKKNASSSPLCFEYQGNKISFEPKATVLDALLQKGYDIPNGCRAGACQSCLMQSTTEIPAQAQSGLTDAQKKLNFFLACQCTADNGMCIEDANNQSARYKAAVLSKDWMSPKVLRLRLELPAHFKYRAGQYVTLWKDELNARSYSLASSPEQEGFLEFHIKVIESGCFSHWAAEKLNIGDTLLVQGPMGQCVYTADIEQPLLLAAIGTGLAPVYGILKDAIAAEHKGDIHLAIGALDTEGFYLVNELIEMEKNQDNLKIHFLTQNGQTAFSKKADLYQYCQQQFPDLKNHRVFLCGASSFVQKMKRQCFLSGAAMTNISADAFLPCHQ